MTDQNDAEKPTEDWVTSGETDAPVGSAERIREAGIVDQQGVVADKIERSDDGDPSRDPEVPPPHRPLHPDEPPTPILPDPGEPGPIVPEPTPAQPEPA